MINILHLDKNLNIMGEIYEDDIHEFFHRDPFFTIEFIHSLYLQNPKTGEIWLSLEDFDCLNKIIIENRECAHRYDVNLHDKYEPVINKYMRDRKIVSMTIDKFKNFAYICLNSHR